MNTSFLCFIASLIICGCYTPQKKVKSPSLLLPRETEVAGWVIDKKKQPVTYILCKKHTCHSRMYKNLEEPIFMQVTIAKLHSGRDAFSRLSTKIISIANRKKRITKETFYDQIDVGNKRYIRKGEYLIYISLSEHTIYQQKYFSYFTKPILKKISTFDLSNPLPKIIDTIMKWYSLKRIAVTHYKQYYPYALKGKNTYILKITLDQEKTALFIQIHRNIRGAMKTYKQYLKDTSLNVITAKMNKKHFIVFEYNKHNKKNKVFISQHNKYIFGIIQNTTILKGKDTLLKIYSAILKNVFDGTI